MKLKFDAPIFAMSIAYRQGGGGEGDRGVGGAYGEVWCLNLIFYILNIQIYSLFLVILDLGDRFLFL